jgi:hypothetical protein
MVDRIGMDTKLDNHGSGSETDGYIFMGTYGRQQD